MTNPHSDTEARFNVILNALYASDYMQEQLNNVDSLNSDISDKYLVSLFSQASGINLILKSPSIRALECLTALEDCSELASIINVTTRFYECIDDSCRYQEAIELLELIDHLHKKYGHEIPIIESIHKQSEKQREYLISNLCDYLEHLKDATEEQVRLIVNCLVRCGNFSDRELRLKYLQARDNWFSNNCEEHSGSFDDVVSVYCTGLPMIFKEYKSVFGESNDIQTKKMLGLSSSSTTKEDGAIINSWLLLKTSVFIAAFEVYLSDINQSSLRTPTMISDTMQKCFELTNWLATIGFDFSSQLTPLFSRALIKEVKTSIERATAKFELSFTNAVSKSIESLLLPQDDEILRISNMRPEEQIPKSIAHYPIFKIYCLNLIDSLRWLQTTKAILSPISLSTDTYASLNASLNRIMKALAVILNMDNNLNHTILKKIAISFVTEVLPFITTYCERLFPEKVILSVIGLSKSEFKLISSKDTDKLKNFTLDLNYIAEPLKCIMPTLIQTINL